LEERNKALAIWYQQRIELMEEMVTTATKIVGTPPSSLDTALIELSSVQLLGTSSEKFRWCAVTDSEEVFSAWVKKNAALTDSLYALPDQPEERSRRQWGPILCNEPQRIVVTQHSARSSEAINVEGDEVLTIRIGKDGRKYVSPSSLEHLVIIEDGYARIRLREVLSSLGCADAQLHKQTGRRFLARVLDAQGTETRQRWQAVGVLSRQMKVPILFGGGSDVPRRDRRTEPLWTWFDWSLYQK
jgi:hypothetical protein